MMKCWFRDVCMTYGVWRWCGHGRISSGFGAMLYMLTRVGNRANNPGRTGEPYCARR